MWARRCGAPRRCPSKVKVIIFSAFDGTIGLSIYQYMAGSNISYLDLGSPASSEVQCLEDWPSSGHAISWTPPDEWFKWWVATSELESILEKQHCKVPGISHVACKRIRAPLSDMKRPLALAMTGEELTRVDILGITARFFLLVTICIVIGLMTHDLALIGQSQKDFILDVAGVNRHAPVIRRVWRCLAGYRPLSRLVANKRPVARALGVAVAAVLAPALLVWNLLVFNFVIVPLLLMAFARYPIRMSRAWVFVLTLACSVYGLVLLALQLAYLASPHLRPRYAVTWHAEAVLASVGRNSTALGNSAPGAGCMCGCDYPISRGVNQNIAVIGALTTLRSVFVALRCLKGLRRSQWASLLSVVFPVPVTVYAVDWRQDGKPIRGRSETVAVQEEVAFDPFALMDEQPDSASTTLHLRPEPMNAYRSSDGKRLVPMRVARMLETPAMPSDARATVQMTQTERIGCCGFPWPTGGQQCVYSPEFVEAFSPRPSTAKRRPLSPERAERTPPRPSTAKRRPLSPELAERPPPRPFCVQEPRGCGFPGMRLATSGPLPPPRPH